MGRSPAIPLALALAVLTAAPAAAPAGAQRLPGVIADDLAPPLAGWSTSGRPQIRSVRTRPLIPQTGPTGSDGLSLGPGGSIARTLPDRPWTLSLDVRVMRGAVLEVALGGRPLVLRGDGLWRHVQVAGFEPAEVHVGGSRVVHIVRPGGVLRLRVRRGTAHLTGLVATARDDRRALLLHRLAELHALTPGGRLPLGTGSDGVLRFTAGWAAGFWPGALWRAYDLTGAPLFRTWAWRATLDNDFRARRRYDWGLRALEGSGRAYERLCRSREAAHRCRVFLKTTATAAHLMSGMALGNPGTGTTPTVIWPNRCASCASPDEVETRIDSVMHASLAAWQYARDSADPADERSEELRGYALRHARAVARLLVREDGGTEFAVRTNRLDGTVLAYERPPWLEPGRTWARGQAQAVYGFAALGHTFEAPDLVAVAERAAGYLARTLPPSRVPRHELGDPPDGPEDTGAGAVGAAALMRLADACERMPDACAEGAGRWRELGAAMLGGVLSHVQPHVPMGVLGDQVYELAGRPYDSGDFLLGTVYALEALTAAEARR